MKTITEYANDLERVCLQELATDQPDRPGYFEVVVTDNEQPFLVRWDAGNVEEIWRTSENYLGLGDAVHAIALLPGGLEWLESQVPRLVDERTAAPSDYDMNPE